MDIPLPDEIPLPCGGRPGPPRGPPPPLGLIPPLRPPQILLPPGPPPNLSVPPPVFSLPPPFMTTPPPRILRPPPMFNRMPGDVFPPTTAERLDFMLFVLKFCKSHITYMKTNSRFLLS